jgi:glycerol-3-phosphate acyltransferase PlsY
MTELLTQLGIENVTAALAAIMAFIGLCAFLTSAVTEAVKSINSYIPAKLVCYIVAVLLTTPVFLALMAFMGQPVEWFMVFASFLASFVVAKVAMNGWDDVKERWGKMFGK